MAVAVAGRGLRLSRVAAIVAVTAVAARRRPARTDPLLLRINAGSDAAMSAADAPMQAATPR